MKNLYYIVDSRDNSYYCGLTGWSKNSDNAILYDLNEATNQLSALATPALYAELSLVGADQNFHEAI